MKQKAKLVATLMAMCMVVSFAVIGILAVKTLNMSVGGNISFFAEGVSFTIGSGAFYQTDKTTPYAGITTQTDKMQGFAMNTNTKLADVETQIASWANLDLKLDSQGDAVLCFDVTNDMDTVLYVYILTTLGTNTNDNMTIDVSPNGTQIPANTTIEFSITFDILDTSINAGLSGFSIDISFSKENLVKTQNKIDAATGMPTMEIDYYYIEMGTYNGQPVKWRYVADADGVRYDGTTPIKSLSGYYVMETDFIARKYLDISKYESVNYKHTTAGYTNINAQDYGLSDIRAYLTNTGEGGFIDDIEIEQNNAIYSLIKARSLVDLYSEILRDDGGAIDKTDTNFSLSLTGDKDISNQKDKFWLMSRSEILTFFKNIKDRVWGENGYWLRSPDTTGIVKDVRYIDSTGQMVDYGANGIKGVRPAFKI